MPTLLFVINALEDSFPIKIRPNVLKNALKMMAPKLAFVIQNWLMLMGYVVNASLIIVNYVL